MALRQDIRVAPSVEIVAAGALAGLGTSGALALVLVAFEPTWLGLNPAARVEEIVGTGCALGALVGSFLGLTHV